jgi:hypothetical protein
MSAIAELDQFSGTVSELQRELAAVPLSSRSWR